MYGCRFIVQWVCSSSGWIGSAVLAMGAGPQWCARGCGYPSGFVVFVAWNDL